MICLNLRRVELINTIKIRDFRAVDADLIVALNHQSVAVLSAMDEQRFDLLREQSNILWIAELNQQSVGFLMGFCEGSNYDSVNYQWFNQRYDSFVYIDRVVVGVEARGAGIGSALYAQLEQWAYEQQKSCLVAEVDIVPLNQGSLNFHQRLGFCEAGQQVYGNPQKKVSLMRKYL
jgi:uncharacterized protein